jgi:D,D-heptose 1,7-bisphosphate phosphatase
MKRPAVFFDRDNTLIANDGYLGDPAGVTVIAGAADAVARARSMGYAIVIISNQSGVARGMFDEKAVEAVNQRLDSLLVAANPGAVIDRHEFCPYHPDGTVPQYAHESERRKPKPGMILEAARAMALDLSRSWLVGDAARDIESGKAAGVRTILFHDPALPASPAAADNAKAKADFTVATLGEAIDVIANNAPPPDREEAVPQPTKLAIPLATSQQPLTSLDLKPIQNTLEQILREVRAPHEHAHTDFSVPKLLAGIVQVLALAAAFFAYLYRDKPAVSAILLCAVFLQMLTLTLMLMKK